MRNLLGSKSLRSPTLVPCSTFTSFRLAGTIHQRTVKRLAASNTPLHLPAAEAEQISMGPKKAKTSEDTPIFVAERPVRVYVGGIPWDVPVDLAIAKVTEALKAVPHAPTCDRFEMALFGETEKRTVRDTGKLHKGFGWLHYTLKTEAGITPESLVHMIEGVSAPGLELRFQLAKQQPLAREEIEAIQKREEERQKLREHKRRNRLRKILKRIEALEQIIGEIEQTTSTPIRSLYGDFDDIPVASTSAPTPSAAPLAHDASELKDIDWSTVPPVIDPLKWYFKPRADKEGAVRDKDRTRSPLEYLVVHEGGEGSPGEGMEPDVARGMRKRYQIESFYRVIQRLLNLKRARGEVRRERPLIIDFGCGSGALTLSIAWLFPDCDVLGIDANRNSIDMFNAKAKAAGLSNCRGRCQWIQEVPEEADIALALHACGAASDFALLQAARARAAFACCPCCIGKLKFSLQLQQQAKLGKRTEDEEGDDGTGPSSNAAAARGGEDEGAAAAAAPVRVNPALQNYRPRMYYPEAPSSANEIVPIGDSKRVYKDQIFVASSDKATILEEVEHPRSSWMRGLLGASDVVDKYSLIARAGDISHAEGESEDSVHHRAPHLALSAKTLLELDRVHSMRERGYESILIKALGGEGYPKSDLLLGWPAKVPK